MRRNPLSAHPKNSKFVVSHSFGSSRAAIPSIYTSTIVPLSLEARGRKPRLSGACATTSCSSPKYGGIEFQTLLSTTTLPFSLLFRWHNFRFFSPEMPPQLKVITPINPAGTEETLCLVLYRHVLGGWPAWYTN
jgi:hypothetical protein